MNQVHILKWYLTAGITESIGETPVNRFQQARQRAQESMKRMISAVTNTAAPVISTIPAPVQTANESSFLAQANALAQGAADIPSLTAAFNQFDGCSLKKTAAHTLDGMGIATHPTVLCVIDAPKSADEKAGRLGSGDSGLLLLKMLNAIQLDCTTNTYLAPVIPWRLPGDRKPTENELALCAPFLKRRIDLLNPQFLLIFGAIPTKVLFDIDSIPKARQQALLYQTANGTAIPAVATFGPDMVAKGQSYRTNAWADLQKLQKMINKEKEEKNA